ncbi:MAG: pilus assembly protein N-terminal domain-containing protein, partial [Planctomycetota bacterium]
MSHRWTLTTQRRRRQLQSLLLAACMSAVAATSDRVQAADNLFLHHRSSPAPAARAPARQDAETNAPATATRSVQRMNPFGRLPRKAAASPIRSAASPVTNAGAAPPVQSTQTTNANRPIRRVAAPLEKPSADSIATFLTPLLPTDPTLPPMPELPEIQMPPAIQHRGSVAVPAQPNNVTPSTSLRSVAERPTTVTRKPTQQTLPIAPPVSVRAPVTTAPAAKATGEMAIPRTTDAKTLRDFLLGDIADSVRRDEDTVSLSLSDADSPATMDTVSPVHGVALPMNVGPLDDVGPMNEVDMVDESVPAEEIQMAEASEMEEQTISFSLSDINESDNAAMPKVESELFDFSPPPIEINKHAYAADQAGSELIGEPPQSPDLSDASLSITSAITEPLVAGEPARTALVVPNATTQQPLQLSDVAPKPAAKPQTKTKTIRGSAPVLDERFSAGGGNAMDAHYTTPVRVNGGRKVTAINLRADEVRTYRFASTIRRVRIEDKTVCRVVPVSSNEMQLIGTALGQTTMSVWTDHENREPRVYSVKVARASVKAASSRSSVEKVSGMITDMFPDCRIMIVTGHNRLTLRGLCDSEESAERILRLVRKVCM